MTGFERIYGCLAGLALGDALGMPTEFLTPEQICAELGWVDHLVRAPEWHPHHPMRPGQVTDDTGQTLAVLAAYTADGQLTAEAVARELLRWADDAGELLPLVLGPSTARALDALRRGEDPRQTGKGGKTNGAAYRAVIVGLVNAETPERMMDQVVAACLPTHGTTVAISGAAAVAYAVAAAVTEGASLPKILEAARQGAVAGREHGAWCWGTPLEKRIDLALERVGRSPDPKAGLAELYNTVGTDMLVAESVAAAFGVAALAQGDPMKAVIYGANIGGDTDTIAALAGAVCGALRGIQAVDAAMLAQVEAASAIDLAGAARRLESIGSRRR